LRIARAAQDFGTGHVGHGWNTAIGLATDLPLAASRRTSTWSNISAAAPIWTF
jgi:hypothetical protein